MILRKIPTSVRWSDSCGGSVMPTYNKLVRDRIPELIEQQGKSCVIRRLDAETFYDALVAKLGEEVAEYQRSRDIEELADILEVIRGLVDHVGFAWDTLEAIRAKKWADRGRFSQRLWLVAADD